MVKEGFRVAHLATGSLSCYVSEDGYTWGIGWMFRGGSWRDRPKKARAFWRWGHCKYQPVFDVGFRVVRLSEASAKRKMAKVD